MSSLESIRQTIATNNVISPVGVEVMAEVRGDYRGESVVVSSESSKLADAAEEIGMSVAHRADKKTLGQREVRQGRGTNLEALARIADYYDKLPNMPKEDQLKALVELLKQFQEQLSGGGGGDSGQVTKEDILRALQNFDGDVTHQFAALEIAREHFEATGAGGDFLALLDEARGDFEETGIARDVRAGFAIADLANKAAATLETDPKTVRDTYRSLLRESGNFAQLFEGLKKFDLGKNLSEVIEIFREAAGRDLSSTGPSTDPLHLQSLLTELGKLKKLDSVMDMADQLMRTLSRLIPPSQREGLDPQSLTGRLLAFVSKSAVGLQDARALIGTDGKSMTAAQQVVLANGLKGLHGELPDDLMPSPQARLQQSSTITSLQDSLVEEEEAEYERKNGKKKKNDKDDEKET